MLRPLVNTTLTTGFVLLAAVAQAENYPTPVPLKDGAQAMIQGGGDYGFSEQEMTNLVDHRMFKVLRDALKYRELQKAKPKVTRKVQKAPKKMKPGAKPPKHSESKAARQKQLDRLKKTHSIEDAASLILMS